ncbi:MAG TPA: hypothetical protein VJ123_00435 [Anaerolineales bacterium]|nr:hypothetical protein [Anaerolineales bacterium]
MSMHLRWVPRVARQTGFLLAIDSAAHLMDYGFHVYLGRALPPADFVIVQSVNAILIVLMATFGMLQPVVARYIAEAEARAGREERPTGEGRAAFRQSFRFSLAIGLILSGAAWLARRPLASWLHVPQAAVGVSALMPLLALSRPAVAGALQGYEHIFAFGLMRLLHALGRFAAAAALVSFGFGALGAVAAYPGAGLLSLLGGLALLGPRVWQASPRLTSARLWQGVRLSLSAFIAYAAYMSLLSYDLLWVNRVFPTELAGSYAAAVLFRRVLTFLPGAALVVMYPRIVARVTTGRSPVRPLVITAVFSALSTMLLTAAYAVAGPFLVRLAFGLKYASAAPLLGWMGLAMLGYNLAAVWMSLALATRPWPFVLLMAVMAGVQIVLMPGASAGLAQPVAVFGLTGWGLAVGGLALYWLWLRKRLAA